MPADQEIGADEMEGYIQTALRILKEKNITGKEITPFLLKYIADHTRGESLETNIALVKHNAKIGAEIAAEYASINWSTALSQVP